jgi:predicted DCC family thiol-disulfide oxidoreductase YuxK
VEWIDLIWVQWMTICIYLYSYIHIYVPASPTPIFILTLFPTATFRFVSLQSKVGQSLLIRSGRNPTDISSIVLCLSNGQSFVKSEAILRIAQGLDGPALPLFGYVGMTVTPRFVRDAVYKVVSENRYRFGEYKNDQCRLDLDGEYDTRFVADP